MKVLYGIDVRSVLVQGFIAREKEMYYAEDSSVKSSVTLGFLGCNGEKGISLFFFLSPNIKGRKRAKSAFETGEKRRLAKSFVLVATLKIRHLKEKKRFIDTNLCIE